MAQVLNAAHAEDVGGTIVEPGDAIPDEADVDVVERLETEGKLGDEQPETEPELEPEPELVQQSRKRGK